jgi:hypothetical protein
MDPTERLQAMLLGSATEGEMALLKFMSTHDTKNPVPFKYDGIKAMISFSESAIMEMTMAIIARGQNK